MKNYTYIARDPSGAKKEGVKQAGSSTDIVSWLREQGFTPISVKEVSEIAKQTWRAPQRKRIKSADLAALCWQLTTMVEGGIPITTAIDTISTDVENLQLRRLLQKLLERMERGETLSSGLAEFPNVFNRLSCAIILAGETGGNLPQSLHRLAEYYDSRDKLAKKIKGAIAYPTFVLVFIILIVIFIMAFIIPRFRNIFEQIGTDLPAFTRGFMAFYDAVCSNIFYLIGAAVLAVISSVLLSKTKKGHYFFSKAALGIPLVGRIFHQAFIVIFCKTMSTLLGSGVSVLEVFDILGQMTSNDVIRSAIVRSREHIVGGTNISASMAATGFFPNMVVKMIQVGEESGSLSTVLDRTSDYYERKIDSTLTTLMSLLEPIMIIVVGAIVLVVVLAMYLPIFSMSKV